MGFGYRLTNETHRRLADIDQDVAALDEPRHQLTISLTSTFDTAPGASAQPSQAPKVRGEILNGPLDGLPICFEEDSLPTFE